MGAQHGAAAPLVPPWCALAARSRPLCMHLSLPTTAVGAARRLKVANSGQVAAQRLWCNSGRASQVCQGTGSDPRNDSRERFLRRFGQKRGSNGKAGPLDPAKPTLPKPKITAGGETAKEYIDKAAYRQAGLEKERHSADGSDWADWGDTAADDDWEKGCEVAERAKTYRQKRREAWEQSSKRTPRDAFLRPMVDLKGIQYRLALNTEKSAREIQEEFDSNQWESREGLKYAAFLIGVPLIIGFTVSRLLADPFFVFVQGYNKNAFALSDRTKVEGAREVHKHELHLRMDASVGRAPPLTESELQLELRKEAKRLQSRYKERSKAALLNLLSDGTAAVAGFVILLQKTEGRTLFFRTLSRFVAGLSDTAKAFLIIAGTDILLGYHSEEGWTAAIHLVTGHYGMEVEEEPIYIFVAIVPVTMDALFKYWIFKGLNKQNPAAAVTLRNMDRH